MRILIVVFSILIILNISCSNPSELLDDNIPPKIKITFPANDTTVSGIVDIQCEASDNDGIKNVELIVDSLSANIFDNEYPYVLEWNTQNYKKDSYHNINAIATDKSGNTSISDTIKIRIDNSNTHFVKPVQFQSIQYNCSQMEIKWHKPGDDNFLYYELFYADSRDGNKELLIQKYNIDDTTHIITEFDPTHENWFWIKLIDSLNYSSDFSNGYMIHDLPPKPSTISYIKFINNSFHFSWTMNNEEDFFEYEIIESKTQEITDGVVIYSTQDNQDTTYSISNINLDEFRYYQVLVTDCWKQATQSNIRRGSSYPLIAFNSNQNGNKNIIIADIDGENKLSIAQSVSNGNYPIFAPDGESILFSKNKNLFLADKYGENKILLVDGIGESSFSRFSPDGTKIVFTSQMNGNLDIYTVDTKGSSISALTNNEGFDTWPVFMPGGNKIAYISEINGTNDIYLMNEDGSDKEQLTFDGTLKDQLQVSSDGSLLIYVNSDMPGEEDIISFNIYTKENVNLTSRGNSDYFPLFFPVGDEIIYQALSDTWDIWSMDVNGENKYNITNSTRDDTHPDIYYDGSLIVFNARIDNKSQIYTIDKNGSNLKRITNDDDNYYSPKFQKRK